MLQTNSSLLDFGEIKEGVPLKGSFKVLNTYPQEIEVSRITSSCGCTLIKSETKVLGQNESLDVKFELNTKNRKGDVIKTIHIRYVLNGREEVFSQKFKVKVIA